MNRKISLVLIFVSVLVNFLPLASFFVPVASAATYEDGLIVYGVSGNATPQMRFYDSISHAFDPASGTVSGAQPVIVRTKSSPTKEEYVAAYQDNLGNLRVMCYDGASWTNDWTVAVAPSGTPTTRRFDLAYETATGDVTILYSRNTAATNALAYRTKAGASGCGAANWAAAVNMPTTTTVTTGTVQWVKAVRDGRAGSNLDAFIWADSNRDLGATIWSGSAFSNLKVLETTLEVVSVGQDVDSFDLAYESLSGDLMVAWGSGGNQNSNGAFYNMCQGGTATCTWTAARTAIPSLANDATSLDLSADPTSDRLAFASIGNAGSDLQAAYWSGTAWTGYNDIDTSCETPGVGMRLTQTGWVTNNGITRWFLVYDDSTGTGLGWFMTAPGTALTATQGKQADWVAAPLINDIRGRYELDDNPYDSSEVMLTISDSTNAIFAKQLKMDSAGALTWTNVDGGASLGTKFSHPQQGFSFVYRRFPRATLTISASAGAKAATLSSGNTAQFVHDTACTSDGTCAAFKLAATQGAVTATSIKISEIGTVAAVSDLANPTLIYDTDANYANGTAGTFGSQSVFAADDTITFTNAGLAIPKDATYYFYIRFDLKNGTNYPAGGGGLDFQIAAATDVTVSGTADIFGTPATLVSAASTCATASQTCVRPQITGYVNATEPALNYAASCVDCGGRIGPGATGEQTITISGYGFGSDPGLGARASAANKVEIAAAETKLVSDDGTGNTNVSAWSNTAITISTDTTVAGDADADWGTNFGGAGALAVTAGGQTAAGVNFYIFPQIVSLTVPTPVANAAREYDAGDTDGVITLSGTRFGAAATGGWVRILGCDSTTCSGPTGSATVESWSNTDITVQVPTVISDNVYTGSLAMQQGAGGTGKGHIYTATGFRILPRINSLDPLSGGEGDPITINGNHFCQNNGICPSAYGANDQVTFSSSVSATTLTSWSNSTIATVVPSGTVAGPVFITSAASYTSNNYNFSALSSAPNDPTGINQFRDAALTQTLPIGGTASTTPLYLVMTMQAGASGGTLYPQIEYQPVGTAFTCSGTSVCATAVEGAGKTGPGPVDCSQTANACAIAITPTDEVYHFQARVRYHRGSSDYYSNWVSFGANGENATDFKIDSTGPTINFPGANTCADAVSGLGTNGATITWYVNESADGQIEYSKSGTLSSSVFLPATPAAPVFSHSYSLNNLDSNTTYYFRVASSDADSNKTSRPAAAPYCSFTTLNVTQPAKTLRFYADSRLDALAGGVATSTSFSVHIPEDSVSIKNAFLELTGISPVSGTNNIQVQVNGQPSLTYDIASASSFRILYRIDGANLNLDPVANTLTLAPSSDVNIIGAKVFVTYSFAP